MGPHRASNQQWPRGLSALPSTCCPQGLRLQALPAFHTFCGGTSDEGQGGQSPAPGAKPRQHPPGGSQETRPKSEHCDQSTPCSPRTPWERPRGSVFSFCFLKMGGWVYGQRMLLSAFPHFSSCGRLLDPPSFSLGVCLSVFFWSPPLYLVWLRVFGLFATPPPFWGPLSACSPSQSFCAAAGGAAGALSGVSVPVSVSPAAPP